MTIHLPTLAAIPGLPAAGQLALAEHRELHLPLATNPTLHADAFRALYRRGTSYDVAVELVSRPLTDDLVRHVAVDCREGRGDVLGTLAAATAPAATDLREKILACTELGVADGVLHNDQWTVAEQARAAATATPEMLLEWLAGLDPVENAELAPAAIDAWLARPRPETQASLEHEDLGTVLRAAVRWPQLLDIPTDRKGPYLRSATGSLSRNPRVLHQLLDEAELLASRGRTMEGTPLVEAVALNPYASVRVQRRAARLSRAGLNCHYLTEFRPQPAAGGARCLDVHQVDRFLDAIERNRHAAHRTVWSVVQLALAADELSSEALDRVADYLLAHGRAAGLDRSTAEHALAGHALPTRTRADILRSLWQTTLYHYPYGPAGFLSTIDTEGNYTPELATSDVDQLSTRFGEDREAWALAIVLLRDGWDDSLADLATVVSQLTVQEVVA